MSRQTVPYLKFKPDTLNDAAWRTIIEAWRKGFSNRDAAFDACDQDGATDITPDELNKLCDTNPDISDLRTRLVSKQIRKSKEVVDNALDSEDEKLAVTTAKWLLEHKAADEFCSKSAIEMNNAVITLSIEDKKKAAEEFLKNLEDGE